MDLVAGKWRFALLAPIDYRLVNAKLAIREVLSLDYDQQDFN